MNAIVVAACWGASLLAAFETGLSVVTKAASVGLYRDHLGGPWAAYLATRYDHGKRHWGYRAAVTVGAHDLAYMMALYWFPATRARWERPLLRRYHERLLEHGVADYPWEDLWEDYRLGVLRQCFEAVWGWSARQNSAIWWNHLERVTLAIRDRRCLAVA